VSPPAAVHAHTHGRRRMGQGQGPRSRRPAASAFVDDEAGISDSDAEGEDEGLDVDSYDCGDGFIDDGSTPSTARRSGQGGDERSTQPSPVNMHAVYMNSLISPSPQKPPPRTRCFASPQYASTSQDEHEDSQLSNDDHCGVCGEPGDLMCCEGCPASAHPGCVGLARPPEEDWFCHQCEESDLEPQAANATRPSIAPDQAEATRRSSSFACRPTTQPPATWRPQAQQPQANAAIQHHHHPAAVTRPSSAPRSSAAHLAAAQPPRHAGAWPRGAGAQAQARAARGLGVGRWGAAASFSRPQWAPPRQAATVGAAGAGGARITTASTREFDDSDSDDDQFNLLAQL
jgi:hypothetical protein